MHTLAHALGNPREWPLAEFPRKRDQIEQLLTYGARDVLRAPITPIDASRPVCGTFLANTDYFAIVPVSVLAGEPHWNLETLSTLIGDRLPASAQLHFFQARRDKHLVQKVVQRLTRGFAGGAASVAALPIPFEDIVVIVPLQLVMISVIGAMAGRPLSKDTALEFLAAAGITVTGGMALRALASTVMKAVPLLGSVVGGTVAYTGTIALGEAAAKYFFGKGEAKIPAAAAR